MCWDFAVVWFVEKGYTLFIIVVMTYDCIALLNLVLYNIFLTSQQQQEQSMMYAEVWEEYGIKTVIKMQSMLWLGTKPMAWDMACWLGFAILIYDLLLVV